MAEEGTWDRVLQMLIAAADAGGARVIQTIVRHALEALHPSEELTQGRV